MPFEVLALTTFLVVQWWLWRERTLSDESSKDSRSETRGVIHGSADPSDEIYDDPIGDEEAMEDSSLQGCSTSHVRLPEAHMFPKRRSFELAIAIIIVFCGLYHYLLKASTNPPAYDRGYSDVFFTSIGVIVTSFAASFVMIGIFSAVRFIWTYLALESNNEDHHKQHEQGAQLPHSQSLSCAE
jgi:hypothetical protein